MDNIKKTWRPEDITQEFIEGRPLSYSKLKKFRQSPRNYIHALNTPFEGTDATTIGSAIDTLLLEPHLLDNHFIIYEKFAKKSNADKEKWALMVENANKTGRKLITKEMLKEASNSVESIMSIPEAQQLVEGKFNVQKKLSWRDKKTNIPLIGYQDFQSKAWGGNFVVDLKKSRNADPDKFQRDVFGDLDYITQVGAYLHFYHKKRFEFPDFIFLVVESTEPYDVSVIYVESKVAELAKIEFEASLQAFRYCMDEKLFHQSYEFRLAQTKSYHALRQPGYYKPKFL